MKNLVLMSLVFLGSFAQACDLSAEIIAKVSGIKEIYPSVCVVSIDPSSVKLYQPARSCELDTTVEGQKVLELDEVLETGVKVGIINDDPNDCQLKAGDEINGIISKVSHGIYLE